MARRSIHPIDHYVGARIRMRRHMLDVTQAQLADALGLTFQQVQKYEKGSNRVSASKLQQISHILKVSVPFFFEGAPAVAGQPKGRTPAAVPIFVIEFLTSRDGLALARAYSRIEDPQTRRRVVALIEQIAAQFNN
jgi:transcriptional regulator with XRE-family HTH domain